MGKAASKQLTQQINQLAESQKEQAKKVDELKILLETKIQTLEKKVQTVESLANVQQKQTEDSPPPTRSDPLQAQPSHSALEGKLTKSFDEKVKSLNNDVVVKLNLLENKVQDSIKKLEVKLSTKSSDKLDSARAPPSPSVNTAEIEEKLVELDEKFATAQTTTKSHRDDMANIFDVTAANLLVASYLANNGKKLLHVPFARIVQLGPEQASEFNDLLEQDYAEAWMNMPNAVVEGPNGVEVIPASDYMPTMNPRMSEIKVFGVVEQAGAAALNKNFSLEDFPSIDFSQATHFVVYEASLTALDFVLKDDAPSNLETVSFISRMLNLEKALACLSVAYRCDWDKFFPLVQCGIVHSGGTLFGPSMPGMVEAFLSSTFAQYTPRLLDIIEKEQFAIIGPGLK
jgi:hypothetical protein